MVDSYLYLIGKKTPSIVVWELWKERIKRIFQDKMMTFQALGNKIEISIVETLNNRLHNSNHIEGILTQWDTLSKKIGLV